MDARVSRTRRDVLDATLRVLVDEGWEAVTQSRLAEVAGYSRATVYQHWPSRPGLLCDAVRGLDGLPHAPPRGVLRDDLVAELVCLRDAVRARRLDRILAALVGLAGVSEEISEARDGLVADLEGGLRALLDELPPGPGRDAAAPMLAGTLLQPALTDGRLPDDESVGATVDVVLRGLGAA